MLLCSSQIAFSVGNVDTVTIAASVALGVAIEAYSPLGHTGAPVMKKSAVIATAKAVGKSAAQVALRYIVQKNYSFVTASGEIAYDKEDLDLWSFTLSASQMTALDKPQNGR